MDRERGRIAYRKCLIISGVGPFGTALQQPERQLNQTIFTALSAAAQYGGVPLRKRNRSAVPRHINRRQV